jgi:glutaredoxin
VTPKRKRWPWLLLLATAIALILLLPDRSGLQSPQQTRDLLARLHVKWQRPGPPVVELYGPGCGDCQLLMELLDHEGVPYELVDSQRDEPTRQILAELSKDHFGRKVFPTTPTTIVGTKIIHGPNIKAIVRAVEQQHDWR